VDISGAAASFTTELNLSLPKGISLLDKDIPVSARIIIEPLSIKKITVPASMITIYNSDVTGSKIYSLSQDSIDIIVEGKPQDLENLKISDIRLSISVSNLDVGEHDVPVTVTLPAGVALKENAGVKVVIVGYSTPEPPPEPTPRIRPKQRNSRISTRMEYLIRNVVIPIDEITQANEPALLKERAARLAHVSLNDIRDLRIIRESVDSRKKHHITMVYTLLVRLDGRIKEGRDILIYKPEAAAPQPGGTPTVRPVIVGAGPCGLFCAYTLVENGFSPIVIERGQEVEKRSECVQRFWRDGILNTETNVQFGEGGAGTFSDGKLTTRINGPRSSGVLEAFVRFGAPPDIQYKAKAHIGTDILRDVVRNMREYLKSRGCTFYFSTRMENLELRDGRVHGVTLADGTVIESQAVVLAIGHSARDTFEKLHGQGVEMKQKAFSVGVRIEHLQEAINRAQYGDVRHFKLEAADYQLFEHLQDRTAYTFCMCPGGVVVAAASEENTIVTNGMSYRARNGTNANAAYVVSVGPNDFSGNHPLAV
jgi:uncharacterized FAD-dependent dehydrogenase/archaellum component FlaG (FlaF/FlaG flagellin family)